MALIQKISLFIKKKINILSLLDTKIFRIRKFNPIILISFLVIFSLIFFITSNVINKKNKENASNFKEITRTNEFSNMSSFLISKINSPYKEVKYLIQNNDNIEKILKKFEIKARDIKIISNNLKKKKTY